MCCVKQLALWQVICLAASTAHLLFPLSDSAQALDLKELKSEGLVLSLEEQLRDLTLSEFHNSEPSASISLNGKCFNVELFDDRRESTKVV